jgi:hypothetical protein
MGGNESAPRIRVTIGLTPHGSQATADVSAGADQDVDVSISSTLLVHERAPGGPGLPLNSQGVSTPPPGSLASGRPLPSLGAASAPSAWASKGGPRPPEGAETALEAAALGSASGLESAEAAEAAPEPRARGEAHGQGARGLLENWGRAEASAGICVRVQGRGPAFAEKL